MNGTIGDLFAEIRAFVISVLLAICAGWSSKLEGLIADPVYSAVQQTGLGVGGIAGLLVAFVLVMRIMEEYEFYVAMGVFAIPAIATFLQSWDTATLLFGFSLAGLLIVGGKEASQLVREALPR